MVTSLRITERIEAFARELCEELGEVDESLGVCWLDAIENQAIDISDTLHIELVKKKSVECPIQYESTCPQCSKLGQYQGNRERKLLTRRGPADIAEPEYYCPGCRKSFFPENPSDRG